MKILHVITSLRTGGAEKLIVDLVPRLNQIGPHQVDVALFDGIETPFKQKLQATGCKIYDLSHHSNVYHPILIYRLWKLMRHYDVVHTHNTAPQLFAAIASLFCSAKLYTTEHSTNNRRRKLKCYKIIDRWMYNRYHTIVCISPKAKENLINFIGLKSTSRTTIINNGVDVCAFYQAKPNPALRNGSSRFVVVMVAGFRWEKDQDTLIRAVSHLPKEKFELWLIGDGERRKELEQLVNQLKVNQQVRFWGIRSDIAEILHTADAVVMSSHFEGLSLSSIEGMAVGKPFIASDVDGLHDTTINAGILFPHQDDQALAKIIEELANDSNYYQTIAQSCYERAKLYDIEKTVQEYATLYS